MVGPSAMMSLAMPLDKVDRQMHNDRVLFVLTSADRVGPRNRDTGYEFSEVAHPFLVLMAEGLTIDFASPKGGLPPEEGFDPSDQASLIFRNSTAFARLNCSQPIAEIDPGDYGALFFPGGLGPMVDLAEDPTVKGLVSSIHDQGGIIGAVCHGPAALLGVSLGDGTSLLADRGVAAFTTAEEVGHSADDVPFLLDVALTQQGARHSQAPPFQPHVVVDRQLVTGQNPASAAGVAAAMALLTQSRQRR